MRGGVVVSAVAAPTRLRVFRGRYRGGDPAWFIDSGRDTMIFCWSYGFVLFIAERILTGRYEWEWYGSQVSADHVQPCNASGERAS